MSEIKALDFTPVTPLVSPFGKPPVFPEAHTHPRILVTPESIGKVRENLTHPDHADAYKIFSASAETPYDYPETFEYSAPVLESIADKALSCLLFGDEDRGIEAIDAILHVLRTLTVSPRSDICRAYGHVMYTAARVYDWCFDLIPVDVREEIVSHCEYKLGPNFEVGFPPQDQGMVTGHGSEAQMFRDWLTLGIATFDEHPDIYNYVAGRIWKQAVAPREYYFRSGAHWQGSAYGPDRFVHDLFCDMIFRKMTDGRFHIFTEDMQKAAITFLCNIRADNEPFRDGDDFADRGQKYYIGTYRTCAFLASALYRNPMLRDCGLSGERLPTVSSVFLLVDDPSVGRLDYTKNLPRVRYCGSPRGQYTAHTRGGASVYFKIGESYSANHEWKDSGNFMIFYKGSLASAANCYEYFSDDEEKSFHGYASELDFKYNKMTVSSNCMLVYDPEEDVEERWGNSGGQRADAVTNQENEFFWQWLRKDTINWAKILAHGHCTDRDGYLKYCMLMGDHTGAYSDKIKNYRRTSIAIDPESADAELIVFIYDRLETRDPLAKKTWQMHTMGEYTIQKSRAVSTHKDGGMLVCDTLLPKSAELSVIGSEDERFIVNGVNLAVKCDDEKYPVREDGRGRLTVSPTAPVEVEHFLNVMYVTDVGKSTEAKAELLEGEGYVAAKIDGKIVLFPTLKEGLTEFTVDMDDGCELYATNLMPGKWTDGKFAFIVEAEERMIVTGGCGIKHFRRICE